MASLTSEKSIDSIPNTTHWPLIDGELDLVAGQFITYAYDDEANTVAVTQTIDGQSRSATYQYDRRGFLVAYTPAVPVGYGKITYTWDNLGRKTSMTVPLGFSGSNNARKISYRYKADGTPDGMDIIPVTVTSNASTGSITTGPDRFFYDSSGDRAKMVTKSGGFYYFVYDPTASVPAVVYEQGPTSRYLNIRQSGGALLSRETYNGSGELQASRTYHYDGLGSTLALTNESGHVTDTYSYSEWGSVTHSGTTTDNPYQYAGRYGYYTHYQEPTFGLIQTGVRYYDPTTGRYTQRDPIGDSASAYSYAGNEPMRYIDPSGLSRRGTDDWLADFPEVQPYASFCDASAIPRILVSTVSQEATDSINRDLMTLGLRDCNGNGYGWSGPAGIMMLEDAAERLGNSVGIIAMASGVGGLIERGVAYAAEGAWAAAGKEVLGYAASEAVGQAIGAGVDKAASLFHYTSDAGLNGILASGELRPSLKALNPTDARYGNGQYFTDIVPGTKRPAQLSSAFVRNPWQGRRFTHYLEVDIAGLNVVPGRSHVFVVPNETPLDLVGRILSHGRVP